MSAFGKQFQRGLGFRGRHSLRSIAGGLLLSRHFQGRYVLWEGGFPKPRVINRGGTLSSDGCTLWAGVRLEVAKGATLSIGKGTYLNRSTIVVCHERVHIGDRCKISWDVVITDSDEHSLPGQRAVTAPVVMEDDVWIGFRALVLKGVTIGRGAVIAAGAIVTKDVPPHSLVVGQPARVVRSWCADDVRGNSLQRYASRRGVAAPYRDEAQAWER